MKKIYVMVVALFALFCTQSLQAAVIPYLPPLQDFGGASVDLSTFLPSGSNYTLEVQGTVGVEISIAGGVLAYTPTTNGVVRFSQKNGKVYVYEGNVYTATLTPVWSTTYPTIADATAHTDANNLLQNAGFETPGDVLSGYTTRYKFGSPWVTNVTEAGTGIRVMSETAGNVNGVMECVWRGTGNSNYFSQQLASTIKPNTTYKIIIYQLAGANGTALFNVGLGSTVDGLEYGYMPVLLANAKNGLSSVTLRTPANITSPVYFTFKNTATNTSNNLGGDPLTQIDYLALVEGTDPVAGITGVSSATFVDGDAYAPEGIAVDYLAGDSYDMTSYLSNPSFETVQFDKHQAIPGWTKTGTANSEYCTRNDAGPSSGAFKTGNIYFQYWNSSKPDFSISQTIAGLPNGKYRLTAAAGGDVGTTGTYVYAGENQTHVTSTGDHDVEATIISGSLTIGFKSVSRTVNWAFADNFRLYYLGEVQDPVLTVSETSFFFDANNLTRSFNVSGAYLTEGVTLTAPEGITLSKTSLTASEADEGTDVTAEFTGDATIRNGEISIVAGTLSKTITVTALYGDLLCFTPTYADKTNLIADPFCNNRSKFGGWGNVAITEETAYCGERSIRVYGGSLDASVSGGTAIQSNKTYRAVAKVYAPAGHSSRFGLFGIGYSGDIIVSTSQTNDAWETADFTFKTATVGSGGIFFQRASGTENVYVDNIELYEVAEPTIRVKYVSKVDENISLKEDRVYNATWGANLADYLTIGKTYSALESDKDGITVEATNYVYDNTSVDNVTIAEGENVIVLKFKVDSPSTGVDSSSKDAFSVYPTIANGHVNVDLKGKSGLVKVFDTTGRLVVSKQVTSSIERITLVNSGIYILEVTTQGATEAVKVINMR